MSGDGEPTGLAFPVFPTSGTAEKLDFSVHSVRRDKDG